MKTFRSQHDHTECVTTAVDSILQVVEPEIGHLLAAANGTSELTNDMNGTTTLSRPSSWSDMFRDSPLIYLRLSLFLDLALSRGKAPHVTDLPLWTLGSAAALQAPSLSSSLHLMSPNMSQAMLAGPAQSRFVELSDDENALADQCKSDLRLRCVDRNGRC